MEQLRQFDLRGPSGESLVTWLPEQDTRQVTVGTVISLAGEPDRRWRVRWRSAVTRGRSDIQKRRFTNSATRDRDGHWVT